jgi:transposase
MRKGIEIEVTAADRARLEAIVADRNSPQKHVWRARIILATADGCGTAAIMRRAGVSKPSVWRWQARFMAEGVSGLGYDKTRPARLAPLSKAVVEAVVTRTLEAAAPDEATHWTAPAMAQASGLSVSSVQRIWRAHGLRPHQIRTFKLSTDRGSPRRSRTSSGCMSIRRPLPWCCRSTRRARFRPWTGPSQACR